MGIRNTLAKVVGVSGHRSAAPPRYRSIAPGLIVTATTAWAWYEITETNSDLLPEVLRDIEQDRASSALRTMRGMDCHLRTGWARIDGEEYLAGIPLDEQDTDISRGQRRWAELHADSIDDDDMPTKRVLLGIKLENRKATKTTTAAEVAGISTGRPTAAEMTRYTARVRQLGQQLHATVLRAKLASTETLAWMISRELYRNAPIPPADTLTGAPLARLSTGRVEPMFDHLQILGPNGKPAGFAAVLALTDFPEMIETPGQEWIAVLNHLTTNPADTETGDGQAVAVLAEASIRFTVPVSREATKTVNDVHTSAKEQRKSAAAGSAQEPDEEILLAEQETRDLKLRLARGHTLLVHDHPRVVVHASSRAQLDAKVTAVQAAYDDMGIAATVMQDEQREGWLETLLCDEVRVDDLGHWRDATAFTASWFWGGSRVGSRNPAIPACGYTTGSTQSLVRFLATDAVERSDAPISAFLGRTRRGKTMAMMVSMLDVALWPGHTEQPWEVLIDVKGDTSGLVDVARQFGVPADLTTVDAQHVGAFDTYHCAQPEHAIDFTAAQLSLIIPDRLAAEHQPILQRQATSVGLNDPDPWAWKVVAAIVEAGEASKKGSPVRELADTLTAATSSGWGRLIAGKPGPDTKTLRTEPGLTVLHLPGLSDNLPQATDGNSAEWSGPQRAAVAALRGVLGWCTTVGASIKFRNRAKVIGVPEVHVLTANQDGRTFLTQIARMGAAFKISLLLDTQDATGLAEMPAIVEATSAVFGFAQQSPSEQDALARMLNLPVGENTRQLVDELDRPTLDDLAGDDIDAYQVRRGHCIYRDARDQVATFQWVVPAEVIDMLDTSAQATSARYQAEQVQDSQTVSHEPEHATPAVLAAARRQAQPEHAQLMEARR